MKEIALLKEIETHFESVFLARSLALNNDKKLLEFLLTSSFKDEYKKRFFEEFGGILVFKKEDFLNFLDLKILNQSYTSFSNKIGLGFTNKKYLKNNEQVVLNFPFKDCVLKGGASKDEKKENSKEIFFNTILAKSEIDILFKPKVLQNFELVRERERERTEPNLKNA